MSIHAKIKFFGAGKLQFIFLILLAFALCSVSVFGAVPVVDTLFLNTTDPTTNNTNQNITANVSFSDTDADSVKLIYNWLVNDSSSPGPGKSITILNMPFEKVNGTNTNNAYDYSGYGNNGTQWGGATWNSSGGLNGTGAYDFNGLGYIELSDNGYWDSHSTLTVSTWIKTLITDQSGKGLVSHDDSEYKWLLYYTGGSITDTLQFYVRTTSGSTFASCELSDGQISDGDWHHVLGTYDQSLNQGRIKIYVNGTLCDTTDGFDEPILDGDEGVTIGRWRSGYFNGAIDELLIFNRSLSYQQVWNLYAGRINEISFNETTSGQNWTVDVTPNDGSDDGAMVRSNQLIITSLIISEGSTNSTVSGDRRYSIDGARVTTGTSSSWNETSAGSDISEGGNVTNLNLSTTASTIKWQGYYGEVSAELGLGENNNARTLYSFGSAQNDQVKAVYASTDSVFDFSSLKSNVALTTFDMVMGWPSSDSDSANTTFGAGLDNQTISRLDEVQVSNLNSYSVVGSGSGQEVNYNGPAVLVSSVFHSGVFADTTAPITLNDYAFAVQINSTRNATGGDQLNRNFLNQTGAGGAVDFELVVAINSTAQHGETPLQKTYFFFLDVE